ncbi:glycosyltransferase family 2 protein [Bacteroidota bacterium]
MEISVVIPVYNEESNLDVLFSSLLDVFSAKIQTSWEVIFVDDGSLDESWSKISDLAKNHNMVKGFRFSRNFGHQYALKAGLDMATGSAVISMDADMQHPPMLLADFYQEWKNGNQIVYAVRRDTKGVGSGKKLSSRMFYKVMNFLSDIKIEDGASDFRLLDRKVVDQIKGMQEYFLFIRGIVSWVGFKAKSIEYVAEARHSGKSKFTLSKMLRFGTDGIMSFSIKPLRLATLLGFIISSFAFVYIIYALIAKYILHNTFSGWTSLLISILLMGGIQLITIGIIGEYIGKLFMEIKKRPRYIISETIENQQN